MKNNFSKSLLKKIIIFLLFPLTSLGQTYDVETTYDPWTNSSKSTIKKRESPYGRKSYKPNIKSFTPNYRSLERTLNARSAQESAISAQLKSDNKLKSDIENARLRWNAIYNPTNNASRLEHANVIRNYHKSLIVTTSLPKAVNKADLVYSDVFIIKQGSSMSSTDWNDQGTLVYSGKAYYSYNQFYGAYEISVIIYDNENNSNCEIFKRNTKYANVRTKEEIKYAIENVNANPCPMNSYLTKTLLINSNGKIKGEYKNEHIVPECIKLMGKGTDSLNYFEVYFIKDLETFSKKK